MTWVIWQFQTMHTLSRKEEMPLGMLAHWIQFLHNGIEWLIANVINIPKKYDTIWFLFEQARDTHTHTLSDELYLFLRVVLSEFDFLLAQHILMLRREQIVGLCFAAAAGFYYHLKLLTKYFNAHSWSRSQFTFNIPCTHQPKQMSSDSSMRVQFTPSDSTTVESNCWSEIATSNNNSSNKPNQIVCYFIQVWPSYCLCKFTDRICRCLLLPFSRERTRTHKTHTDQKPIRPSKGKYVGNCLTRIFVTVDDCSVSFFLVLFFGIKVHRIRFLYIHSNWSSFDKFFFFLVLNVIWFSKFHCQTQ